MSANPQDWEESVATSSIESLMRDCAFLERYAGTRRAHPYEALRLFAAKAEGQGIQVAVTDSEHGPLFLFEGQADAGALVFSMSAASPKGAVLLRLRFTDIRPDAFVVESQRSVDEGKTWDTTGRAEYRRRAASG